MERLLSSLTDACSPASNVPVFCIWHFSGSLTVWQVPGITYYQVQKTRRRLATISTDWLKWKTLSQSMSIKSPLTVCIMLKVQNVEPWIKIISSVDADGVVMCDYLQQLLSFYWLDKLLNTHIQGHYSLLLTHTESCWKWCWSEGRLNVNAMPSSLVKPRNSSVLSSLLNMTADARQQVNCRKQDKTTPSHPVWPTHTHTCLPAYIDIEHVWTYIVSLL